ncbi:lactate racemase domain-containing protein [Phytohabitans sp. ZYX-F-186]|uniref:Lactate racemase domain-containing protein n=1 Tax=Phytohabitans maris TaxID=3071409 RepID=A0ABU0ZAG0_9ACTN|nr:lactate racemase domain-containing protein [Phytohabitans sp. ZYX-F-186]MDQ7904033.1 lactate racemase domain-containing protein [Phytohabitans sp. ZYX-F-186]
MLVELAYGSAGLVVELPDRRTTVITPHARPAAADERAELRRALRHPVAGPPLRERVRRGQTVAISACDGTRPRSPPTARTPPSASSPKAPRRSRTSHAVDRVTAGASGFLAAAATPPKPLVRARRGYA